MSAENSENAPAPQPLDQWFLDLLACPACEQHLPLRLSETKDTLLCGCGRYAYPIRDGIPILLVDEATVLDENARPENVTREA
ncbi:MAG TPA: Trm112 family protein [Chthonomonadaceae bacterium]|nr:Trm112 family protein [Chthonomonadaceae bacterium]